MGRAIDLDQFPPAEPSRAAGMDRCRRHPPRAPPRYGPTGNAAVSRRYSVTGGGRTPGPNPGTGRSFLHFGGQRVRGNQPPFGWLPEAFLADYRKP